MTLLERQCHRDGLVRMRDRKPRYDRTVSLGVWRIENVQLAVQVVSLGSKSFDMLTATLAIICCSGKGLETIQDERMPEVRIHTYNISCFFHQ